MAAFICRYPVIGYDVQAFVADDLTKGGEDAFQSVTKTGVREVSSNGYAKYAKQTSGRTYQ